MIFIDNTIISEDLLDVMFSCPLEKCKGACCIEGDAGAPLEIEEISSLEDFIDKIKPFMTERGRKVIQENGVFDYDVNGEFVTPLVNDAECAFTNFSDGIAWCSIEKAKEEGEIDFQKPVSCHLYPVRIKKHKNFVAVNYHKWHICKAALKKGSKQGLPLYKFLKEPLIRMFGLDWYEKLDESVNTR